MYALATFTINHLKEDSLIDFHINKRGDLIDATATEYGVSFATDEDIRDRLEEVEENSVQIQLLKISQSQKFIITPEKKLLSLLTVRIFQDYILLNHHQVAVRMNTFLLNSDLTR